MLGGNSQYDCLFKAVEAVTPEFLDRYRLAEKSYQKTVEYDVTKTKGLTREDANRYLRYLTSVKVGWQVHVRKNQYRGQYMRSCGVAYCLRGPGVYLVAASNKLRQGHVVMVTAEGESGEMELMVRDGQIEFGLGDCNFHEILWVRKIDRTAEPKTDAADEGDDRRVQYRALQKAKKVQSQTTKRARKSCG